MIDMIIYIASYPRSGNSLTQRTIITYFERPITAINPKSKKAEFFAGGGAYFVKNWRYSVGPTSTSCNKKIRQLLWHKLNNRIFKIHDLNKWTALYDLNVPPYNKNCRYLLPGCKNVLTPKNRQLLAADRNSHIFLKTHKLPFRKYFEGEYVIQPIRHPGAVLWSYFNLMKANHNNTTISLEKVIRGKVEFGSWSNYHQIWSQAIPLLNGRLIRIRFEDLLSDPLKVCAQISATIGLEYNQANIMPSFEELNQQDPQHFRAGQVRGWQEHYSCKQIQLLKSLHDSAMQQLGYEMPETIKVTE